MAALPATFTANLPLTKTIVSRCTGRVHVPSDPKEPWTPELLEKLFPKKNRVVWGEVVSLTYEQHNAEEVEAAKAG